MEILTLVENSCSDPRLKEEFGLSLLVQCAGGKILFDMGSTSLFAQNAEILGEDLSEVDCAVISHAHYDHGGGLGRFREINERAGIYVGVGADGTYYANAAAKMPLFLLPLLHPLIEKNPYFCKYIGLERQALRKSRLQCIEAPREILENVFLLVDIGNKHALPEGNTFLLEETENGLQRDRFVHELIMVIREPDGLVLFTGCGHRGIANMMDTVLRHFAGERLKGIVGGFHLALQPGKPAMAGSREDIIALARQCRAAGVDKVLTGHCTGDQACAIIKEELGERAGRLSTGFRCSL